MANVSGWIKLHRSLLDWEWYKDLNTRSLFLHLLIRANHKENKFQGNTIKRGQILTGINSLSFETSLSVQKLRTSLSKLKSTNDITIESTNKNSIITIVNYDFYQSIEDSQQADQQTDNNQLTNDQQTDNKRITTNKNIKKVKNTKNDKKEEEVFFSPETSSVEGDDEKVEDIEINSGRLKKGLNSKARVFFEKFYQEKFNESYYFDKVNAGQLSNLLKKINFKIKEKQKIDDVDIEKSLEGFEIFVKRAFETKDNFLSSNFTIPILSSKFNEIFLKISGNGQTKTNPGDDRQQRVDDVAKLREIARQVIRS